MVNLMYRDLIHKKGKLLLILIGLSVSVFLVQYSAGMFNGVLTQSSELFDRFESDTWIRQEDNDNFLDGGFIDDDTYNAIKNLNEIEDIERLIYEQFDVQTKEEVGYAFLIGYELDSEVIEPWNVIKGDVDDLERDDTIIVDQSLKNYFPDLKIGDKLQVGREDMEVVGFCKNARFMFNPYIWASLDTARKAAPYLGNWSSTFAVELDSHSDIEDLRDELDDLKDLELIEDVDVFTKEELKENTYDMIVNEGGLGGAIYILVGMGFFVSIIILTVVMYQSIQEKIPEFGTLKAIGASKRYLTMMLLGQVFLYITISFLLGTFLAVMVNIMQMESA
ncbi:MAG: ABC transporter permease, partial [Candidatus Hermodarchaeota archaeon]